MIALGSVRVGSQDEPETVSNEILKLLNSWSFIVYLYAQVDISVADRINFTNKVPNRHFNQLAAFNMDIVEHQAPEVGLVYNAGLNTR